MSTMQVSLLVLAAALMHALWNTMVKVGEARLLTMALISTTSMLAGGVLALLLPLPLAESWPFLVLSTLVHYAYKTTLVLAYRLGDLSLVYPLSRGSGPLLLALAAAVAAPAGQGMTPASLAGVLLISLGVISLAWPPGRGRGGGGLSGAVSGNAPAAGVALAVGVMIALYTWADGQGVRASGRPLAYIGWLFLLDGLPWAAYLGWRSLRPGGRPARRSLLPGVGAGLLSLAAYGLVVWALSQGNMVAVAALRETGVLFATLLGVWRLGEPLGGRRLAASCCVVAGIALLHFPAG